MWIDSLALCAAAVLIAGGKTAEPLDAVVEPGASVAIVAGGIDLTEGPVWTSGSLYFTDPAGALIYRWTPDAGKGSLATFRRESGHAVGLSADARGRLIAAEADGRITRLARNGTVQATLAPAQGGLIGTPNDVAVRADGTIFFTDAKLIAHYSAAAHELGRVAGVYRISVRGEVSLAASDLIGPDGLGFSPDQHILYVSDAKDGTVRAYDVASDGTLSHGRTFAEVRVEIKTVLPGGVDCDSAGNVYVAAMGGVWVFDSAGARLGVIKMPKNATNLCFGGSDGKTLFITGRAGVYSIRVRNAGAGFGSEQGGSARQSLPAR